MTVEHKIESVYRCDTAGCKEYVIVPPGRTLEPNSFTCVEMHISTGTVTFCRSVMCKEHLEEFMRCAIARFGFV